MEELEKYYTGDANWDKFSSLFKNRLETNLTNELTEILKDKSLAKVIEGVVGDTALDWIERKIPALDNLRPVDCINNNLLLNRLREMLMRM